MNTSNASASDRQALQKKKRTKCSESAHSVTAHALSAHSSPQLSTQSVHETGGGRSGINGSNDVVSVGNASLSEFSSKVLRRFSTKPLTFNDIRLKTKLARISFETTLAQIIASKPFTQDIASGKESNREPSEAGGLPVASDGSPSLSISNNSVQAPLPATNLLQGGHKRIAEVIAQELIKLARVYGIERLGFFTLTFAGEAPTMKEAMRRFNNLRSNVLTGRYVKGLRVVERGESTGRLHFHCVIVLDKDIRTGFDFEAVASGDYRSANEYLKSEWAFWRETAPGYGFGRTELLPVRSTAEGIARYVGSYVGKHIRGRFDEDKGARLVGFWGYGAGERAATAQFAFRTENSAIWRFKVAKWAAWLGAKHTDDLKRMFGAKWCFMFYEEIMLECIDGRDGMESFPASVKAAEADTRAKEEIGQRWEKARQDRQWLQFDKWEKSKERYLEPVLNEARSICRQVADEQMEEMRK